MGQHGRKGGQYVGSVDTAIGKSFKTYCIYVRADREGKWTFWNTYIGTGLNTIATISED